MNKKSAHVGVCQRFILLLLIPALYAQTEYPIGAGDLLAIDVLGVPDFTRELRVSASGAIVMPFLGEVQVKGLTLLQAQQTLTKLLNPAYVKDPQVSIMIKELRSRRFSVVGAVLKPDQYQIAQPITLVEAIAAAGGVDSAKAGDIAQIQRLNDKNDKSDSTYQIEVNLRKLLYEGDMSENIPIMPGDVISIPAHVGTSVYVIGDVNKPGSFDYSKDLGMMLSRAISLAGGPTKTTQMKGAILIRRLADGNIDRKEIDLGKLLKGKIADIAMQPDDLLFVPGSVGRSLSQSILQSVPSMITWGIIR
jgi:polysaccharide export outer membrane protein